ncbi:MAG: 3-mercaptopyruvate sulfurtransferase [Propylenella sp.]
MSGELVTAEWLKERLDRGQAKAVDASWYLPAQNRDPNAEFLAGHIPGAVYFDIDAIADHSTGLPHMLPDEAAFAAAAGALGLSESDTIVVYDGMGIFSSARVWWMLRTFGARDVHVLDGGLPAWKKAGFPLEAGEATPAPVRFRARFDRDAVVDFDAVGKALKGRSDTVVDARSAPRFRGESPEPRPGVRAGHMPGARNLHYETVLDPQGRMRPPEEISAAFQAAGVDLSQPVITSCGSGVTAATLLLALAQLGKHDVRLYDGSWSEWGAQYGAPVATGDA